MSTPTARFENAQSLHPVLSIELPGSTAVGQSSCAAYVLVHLPEGLFFDPFTAPKHMHQPMLLTERVELEKAVGWSLMYPDLSSSVFSSHTGESHRQWWEQKPDDDDNTPLGQLDAQMQMEVGVRLEQALREAAARLTPADAVDQDSATPEGRRSVLQGVLEPGSGTGRAERTSVLVKLNATLPTAHINIPLHARYATPTTGTEPSSPLDPHASVGLVASTAQLISELVPSFLLRLASQLPLPIKLQVNNLDTAVTRVTIDTPPAYFTDCPDRSATPVGLGTLFPYSHHHLLAYLPAPLTADTPVWTSSAAPLPSLHVPTANFDLRESVQLVTASAILLSLVYLVRTLYANIARLKQVERP